MASAVLLQAEESLSVSLQVLRTRRIEDALRERWVAEPCVPFASWAADSMCVRKKHRGTSATRADELCELPAAQPACFVLAEFELQTDVLGNRRYAAPRSLAISAVRKTSMKQHSVAMSRRASLSSLLRLPP